MRIAKMLLVIENGVRAIKGSVIDDHMFQIANTYGYYKCLGA